jgi:hypothetical protein
MFKSNYKEISTCTFMLQLMWLNHWHNEPLNMNENYFATFPNQK